MLILHSDSQNYLVKNIGFSSSGKIDSYAFIHGRASVTIDIQILLLSPNVYEISRESQTAVASEFTFDPISSFRLNVIYDLCESYGKWSKRIND